MMCVINSNYVATEVAQLRYHILCYLWNFIRAAWTMKQYYMKPSNYDYIKVGLSGQMTNKKYN